MEYNVENTLLNSLGIDIKSITNDGVVATMPVDERTRQPFGILHGGASVALAETVASIGAYHLIDQETEMCVGLEINANHIRGKQDGTVTAHAIPVHRGKQRWCGKLK